MRTLILSCFVIISFLSCKDEKKEEVIQDVEIVTTYYLIRHAEKDRSDSTNTNPALTTKGLERAKLWASYFDSIPLDKIYSTNYVRTQQTAKDVSEKKSLPIESYEPKSLITDDFKEATKGKHILIVGHSNTTPMLVNQLLGNGKFDDIPDNDNSRLYVVELSKGKKCANIRKVEL